MWASNVRVSPLAGDEGKASRTGEPVDLMLIGSGRGLWCHSNGDAASLSLHRAGERGGCLVNERANDVDPTGSA